MGGAINASRNRLRRPIAALVLAPLLLFALSAYGYDGLRCQFMGVVERCCCPHAQHENTPASQTPGATIDRGDCCAQFRVTVQKAPTDRARAGHEITFAPIAVTTTLPVTLPRPAAGAALLAAPPKGPPILLVKQSFLI